MYRCILLHERGHLVFHGRRRLKHMVFPPVAEELVSPDVHRTSFRSSSCAILSETAAKALASRALCIACTTHQHTTYSFRESSSTGDQW